MKIDRHKLDMALARKCMSLTDIRAHNVHPSTLSKIRNNPNYQPATRTIGKIAKVLQCDVSDIVKEE